MPLAEDTIRIAAATQILSLAFLFSYRYKLNRNSVLTSAFLLSIVCYLLRVYVRDDSRFGILTYCTFFSVFALPFLFWTMSKTMFDDEFSFSWFHWLQLVAIEAADFLYFFHSVSNSYRISRNEDFEILINSIPYLIQLVYAALAISEAIRGKNEDLLNQRLKFRTQFIFLAGFAIAVVSVIELMFVGEPDSVSVHTVIVGSILVISTYSLLNLLSIQANFFVEPRLPAVEQPALSDELLAKFRSAIEDKKAYLEPDVSVKSLALQLGEAEYKVRHLINSRLSYRNFNEFLNHYRIEEAKVRLKESDSPVETVAYEVGYNSLAPFNRAFKSSTQMTPSAFRQNQ